MNKKILYLTCALAMIGWAARAATQATVANSSGNQLTRAIAGVPAFSGAADGNEAKFSEVAASGEHLFLGASAAPGANKKAYALSRVDVDFKTTPNPTVTINPIAPAGAVPGTGDLNNLVITNLAVMGTTDAPQLAVTANNYKTPAAGGAARASLDVVLVTNPLTTGNVLKDTGDDGAGATQVKDANHVVIDKPIVALSGSQKTIFATVTGAGKNFNANDGANRGVAVAQVQADGSLKAVAAANFANAAGDAAKLDVTMADDNVGPIVLSFFGTGVGNHGAKAIIGSNNVASHWDPTLERLYVGIGDIGRDNVNAEGGVLSVAMGRFADTTTKLQNPAEDAATAFVLKPIVSAPKKAHFYVDAAKSKNVDDCIVGFYYDGVNAVGPNIANRGNQDLRLSAEALRVMHTSTNKDYLIMSGSKRNNGGIPIPGGILVMGAQSGLFALPLVGAYGAADVKGTVAKVANGVAYVNATDKFEAPAALADMPRATHDATMIGGNKFLWNFDKTQDIFVSGDSVYTCAAGNTPNSVGMFRSTAIFNKQGVIAAWTPGTRVMGRLERVYGGTFLPSAGSYLYLTEHTAFVPTAPLGVTDVDTAKLTWWGKGDTTGAGTLDAVLEANFPSASGGVLDLISFDEYTPGFAAGRFAMMVALGVDRIAIIQSGAGANVGAFQPTATYAAAGATQNVFVKTDLAGIGPVTCAELARSVVANQGWLFVGGYNGVSVLRAPLAVGGVAGNGFNSFAGLDALTAAGYPGNAVAWTFKKLLPAAGNSFDRVRKIVCLPDHTGASKLFIMTDVAIYAIDMTAAKFADAAVAGDLAEVKLDISTLPTGARLTDLVPVSVGTAAIPYRAFYLATSMGLYKLIHHTAGDQVELVEIPVKDSTNTTLVSPAIVQLQYISNGKGGPAQLGNLYVLAATMALEPSKAALYPFAVNFSQGPIGIEEQIISGGNPVTFDLERFRGNFLIDGPTLLHTRSLHFDQKDFVNMRSSDDITTDVDLTTVASIDTKGVALVGSPIRDDASGALMIPGDFGVRVNQ